MKRILLFATVGLVAFLGFLVAKAPASLVTHWMPEGEDISFHAPSGTLWNGRFGQLQIGPLRFGPLEWDVRLSRLLLLRLDADVNARLDDGRVFGRAIVYTNGRIRIPQARGQDLPLPRLAPLFSQDPDMMQGTGAFEFTELEFRDAQPWSGEGQLRVFDLRANLGGMVALGSYGGQVDGREGEFELQFTDAGENGPFALNGDLHYQAQERRYEVDGRIRARDNAPANIAGGLQYLGQEDEEGFYPLRFSGRLQ